MHLTLCVAWVSLALTYACLALDAHASRHSKLPRAGFRIPVHRKLQVSNARLEELLNAVAEKYDATMNALERSVQSSTQTRFRVDSTAAVLSLCGLGAQALTLRRLARTQSGPVQPIPIVFRRPPVSGASPLQPAGVHEGSFPEGGYAS